MNEQYLENNPNRYRRLGEFFQTTQRADIQAGIDRERAEQMRPISTSEAYREAGIDAEGQSKLGNIIL